MLTLANWRWTLAFDAQGKVVLVRRLRRKQPAKVVAIAAENKAARIAWAIMSRGDLPAAGTRDSGLKGLAIGL